MKIDFYEFGRIIVNGQEYRYDLIIFPDRVLSPWWRLEGHCLEVADLKEVWSEKADFLVIGTGAYGVMKVREEVKKKALELGFTLIIQPTFKAVETFNQKIGLGKVIGAFHLTC